MFDVDKYADRLRMRYDAAAYRRIIAGQEVILHCHHYNSRLQNTIESASQIDGKKIISRAAEAVFAAQLRDALRPGDDDETKWKVAQSLYAHLGYGWFEVHGDKVTARSSHFVEGWNTGFPERKTPVCTFTEGYLQGAFAVTAGKPVWVKERECMASGAQACTFEVDRDRSEPLATHDTKPVPFTPKAIPELPASSVDSRKIIDALVAMPIHGNTEGLIPAFGVYLASTPADFYNRICIDFVDEMTKVGQGRNARKLLVFDAETCGMNTFRGIMTSPEWDGLVAPMLQNEDDELFGIVAVSNALGWGNWHVTAHRSGITARIESFNGYEALGYREYRGTSSGPQCLMLTGVAAGIMELVYSKGSIQDRFGTFASAEHECISAEHASCVFQVEKA
jgi:predicted hydrocarbon binding protein